MQRIVILALAALLLIVAAVLAVMLLRGQPDSAPITIDAADENGTGPYQQEIDCIDRLLQQQNLSANDVAPAFARCKSRSPGNQSAEQ